MSIDRERITQASVFANELLELKPDITMADRAQAMAELNIKSKATISNYINGDVRDNDTAANLIKFFKKRISDRNKVLS